MERVNATIDQMHKQGFSIIQSIKFVHLTYDIGLGEAKHLVSSHPSWSVDIEDYDRFHREMTEWVDDGGLDVFDIDDTNEDIID